MGMNSTKKKMAISLIVVVLVYLATLFIVEYSSADNMVSIANDILDEEAEPAKIVAKESLAFGYYKYLHVETRFGGEKKILATSTTYDGHQVGETLAVVPFTTWDGLRLGFKTTVYLLVGGIGALAIVYGLLYAEQRDRDRKGYDY